MTLFFPPLLPFFTSTSFATQRVAVIASFLFFLFCFVLFLIFLELNHLCQYVLSLHSLSLSHLSSIIYLLRSYSVLRSSFLKGGYSLSFLIIKAFSTSTIIHSSSVISVSRCTLISDSMGSIGPFSFRILSSVTRMSLISWFSSPSLGVKIFLLIAPYSTEVTHFFISNQVVKGVTLKMV